MAVPVPSHVHLLVPDSGWVVAALIFEPLLRSNVLPSPKSAEMFVFVFKWLLWKRASGVNVGGGAQPSAGALLAHYHLFSLLFQENLFVFIRLFTFTSCIDASVHTCFEKDLYKGCSGLQTSAVCLVNKWSTFSLLDWDDVYKRIFLVLAACETYSHKRLEAFGPEKLLIVSLKCTLIRCDSPNFQGSAFWLVTMVTAAKSSPASAADGWSQLKVNQVWTARQITTRTY